MRVAIGTTTGFHLRYLAVQLQKQPDVHVDYFTFAPWFRMRRDELYGPWAKSLFWGTLPDSALAQLSGNPLQANAVLRMLRRTDEKIARALPMCDVYIGLSSMAIKSASAAAKMGARVVVERSSRHVLSQNEILLRGGAPALPKSYIERELASYEQADLVTVLSSHAAESFEDAGFDSERIFICPPGVDLTAFSPGELNPSEKLRVLFVGAWSARKGVDLLLEALKSVRSWTLTHVGSVTDSPFPAADSRVRSVGHKNHQQLKQIMHSHDLLVLPSREDGFGMVLLEALASGLPVVATNMTGAPDIRRRMSQPEWVEIAVAGDAASLAAALTRMQYKVQQSFHIGSRETLTAQDRIAFGWEAYGQAYLEKLETLAG